MSGGSFPLEHSELHRFSAPATGSSTDSVSISWVPSGKCLNISEPQCPLQKKARMLMAPIRTFHVRELFYEQNGLLNPDGAQLNS